MKNSTFILLAEAGQRAPSADNTQPWVFYEQNNELQLFIDIDKLKNSCFDVEHPAILLAIGAVIENIIQAAEFHHIDLEFNYSAPQDSGKCATFKIKDKNFKGPDKTAQPALFNRCTNRLPFNKKTISQAFLDDLLSLSTDNARLVAYQTKQEIAQWTKWVCIASEVRFQTPDVHEWFGQSLKFTSDEVASCEGLDVKALELPAIGNFLLKATQTWKQMQSWNKFYAYKALAKLESLNVNAAPALLGIVAPLGAANTIEAGRLMEKMWIKANALGLSIQPYFVISDQLYRLNQGEIPSNLEKNIAHLQDEINSTLKLNNEFVYILFRVGYCDKSPKKSLRRPVQLKT